MADTINSNGFENQFWLQTLGDQARLVLYALSPNEAAELIADARKFVALLDSLLTQSRKQLSDDQLRQLNEQAFRAVQDFRKFILHILSLQLKEKVEFSLLPVIVNHIVNHTEAYLNILGAFMQNKAFLLKSIVYNIEWLLDAYIYAASIADKVGILFTDVKKQSNDIADQFLILFVRANEMKGFLRIGKSGFPALIKLNQDIVKRMKSFSEYILNLYDQVSAKEVTGTITPLYLDFLYRTNCYYITILSKASGLIAPVCDSIAPRKE